MSNKVGGVAEKNHSSKI